MQRLLLTLLLASIFFKFSQAQKKERLFDQSMAIHQCNVDIAARGLIVTTWIELEFYNDKDREEEGKYTFSLHPGQAVTGFQLMLGDKYHEGSIDERWKTRAAYGAITGKRMDPALLQLVGDDHYSLNIYPVPAKSSRKVKIRIEELLDQQVNGYHYDLGLFQKDNIDKMNINVSISGYPYHPYINEGLLKGMLFKIADSVFSISDSLNIVQKADINFILPGDEKDKKDNGFIDSKSGEFFVKTANDFRDTINISIKKLRVYWDCSASMNDTDRPNFIEYLNKILLKYKPEQLTIIPFNQQVISEKVFSAPGIKDKSWQQFIEQFPLEGATQFGDLDFSTDDDLILVFTDGKQTWGRKKHESVETPVVFITTLYYSSYSDYHYNDEDEYGYNYNGDYVNLYNAKADFKTCYLYDDAPRIVFDINNLTSVTTGLIDAEDENGIKTDLPSSVDDFQRGVFSGKLMPSSQKLILKYGFGNRVLYQQEYELKHGPFIYDFDKAETLMKFRDMMRNKYWYNTLAFGIDNKILTWQTAYIVLEKTEDYVTYNITPPDDILQECINKGFVQHDYKKEFEQLKKVDDLEMLKVVSAEYNKRFQLWDKSGDRINLDKISSQYLDIQGSQVKENINEVAKKITPVNTLAPQKQDNAKSLQEVVLLGYNTVDRNKLSFSVSYLNRGQLRDVTENSAAEALTGKLAGVQVVSSEGAPGADVEVIIRGGGSITQNNSPLYIIDGIEIENGINEISPQDIENVTVLKDAAATAIYGARGANGVILITTKSGKGNRRDDVPTELKKQDDIDYMQVIKSVDKSEKYSEYVMLEATHKKDMGFYLDMALHFYESGLDQYIDGILMKAAELSYNDLQSQTDIAFIYEQVKQYDKAITIYENLHEDYPTNLKVVRDLAWACYENNQYDTAAKILYNGITKPGYPDDSLTLRLKDMMLADLNMIIALNKNKININYIPAEIIKPVPTDLRVIIESNACDLSGLTVKQPWKRELNFKNPVGRDSARLVFAATDMSINEFEVNKIDKKRYSISVPYYDNGWKERVPALVRIIKIINFGRPGQTIDTDIVSLDNQNGEVEFDDFSVADN